MRRTLLLGSSLVFALAVACGASQSAEPITPAATSPVVEAPAPLPPHAPTPPPPPGVELSSINPTVSPCDDFFHYACGGWIKANPIPEDQGRWGRFNALAEQNELVLRDILENDAAVAAKPAQVKLAQPKDVKAKPAPAKPVQAKDTKAGEAKPAGESYARALGDFYASCMDEETVEKNGLTSIRPLLRDIDGVSDAAGLARVMAELHLSGVDVFFTVESEQDLRDATR